jgi:hypothetical protein
LTTSYSVDSNSRIPSYRLSSLDRLAQRQRLFETTTATSVQPNGLPTTAHPPSTSSSSSSTSSFTSATNVAIGESLAVSSSFKERKTKMSYSLSLCVSYVSLYFSVCSGNLRRRHAILTPCRNGEWNLETV